jgi:hypothetical protein
MIFPSPLSLPTGDSTDRLNCFGNRRIKIRRATNGMEKLNTNNGAEAQRLRLGGRHCENQNFFGIRRINEKCNGAYYEI